MIACLLASSFFLARAGAAFVSSKNAESEKPCIVLDAGHGGSDPGKVTDDDIKEKDINLAIVKKLKTLFENKGFKVVLTRNSDKVMASEDSPNVKVEDMRNRVALITKTNPVMTVSIHQNSFSSPEVKGAQVFYYGQSAEGEALAKLVQASLIERVDPENHRQAKANESYYLLKRTVSPTVIVECGFLSNPAEVALLTGEDYQNRLVWAIHMGVMEFLNGTSANLAGTQ